MDLIRHLYPAPARLPRARTFPIWCSLAWSSPQHRATTAVRAAAIRDIGLRDQALRAAKSVCLNVAEAASRVSPADRARVFGIARGEVGEVAAAVEIAAMALDTTEHHAARCLATADRLIALLTGLIRR